jgi:hypothetical protein
MRDVYKVISGPDVEKVLGDMSIEMDHPLI